MISYMQGGPDSLEGVLADFTAMDLGFGGSVTKFVAQYRARRDAGGGEHFTYRATFEVYPEVAVPDLAQQRGSGVRIQGGGLGHDPFGRENRHGVGVPAYRPSSLIRRTTEGWVR
mgnify:CR=1 FL=1